MHGALVHMHTGQYAYLGISYGASRPLPLLTHEQRLKAAILVHGGLSEDKKMVVYDVGHEPLPFNKSLGEVADWLDKYLGTVD